MNYISKITLLFLQYLFLIVQPKVDNFLIFHLNNLENILLIYFSHILIILTKNSGTN